MLRRINAHFALTGLLLGLIALPIFAQDRMSDDKKMDDKMMTDKMSGMSESEKKKMMEMMKGMSASEKTMMMDKMSGMSPSEREGMMKMMSGKSSSERKMMMQKTMMGEKTMGGMSAMYKEIVSAWPAKSQEVANTIIAKYGPPDEATASMLVWHNKGPWKRTVISRDPVMHDFPMPHPDLMEQFIDYRVPAEKFSDLAAYDGSVIVERTKGEMSARCDKEEANFLALNLANDIVTGKRTVDEARKFYAETIKALMAGQKPAYTEKLQFTVSKGGTADPDKPAMSAP